MFEELLARHRAALERFVFYKIRVRQDAEDVIQDVCVTAFRRFDQLKSIDSFQAWLISIARNKVNDYFRIQARRLELPIDALRESVLSYGRAGPVRHSIVRDALDRLGDRDAQILYLYYWKELRLSEIAAKLNLPLGTVKSRMHAAKQHFRKVYPEPAIGGISMTKLPEKMPAYTIEKIDEAPFDVIWQELIGWMIVPKLGEKLSWGLYESPGGTRTEYTDMQVVGRAEIHGIEGVEIVAVQHDAEDYFRTGSVAEMERRFVAQVTDTHCRYLAESHVEDGVRRVYTFLDGESFLNNWGYGEDNCGTETHASPKGMIRREGSVVTVDPACRGSFIDVVGRYNVTIGGRSYDTICLMDAETFDDAIVSEQYLDANGRTILWRRFNRNDWAFHRYQKKWTEMLPENERLTVNGETYVHWYDCISDYIL